MAHEYICSVQDLLSNPVYNSLLYNDSHLGFSSGKAVWFDEEVSPFAGFEEGYTNGFDELHKVLPADRKILFAIPYLVDIPGNWEVLQLIKGLQFVFDTRHQPATGNFEPTALNETHVDEMIALARLTKPGPFAKKTIEFGYYHGVFENGKLAAMTGQRMHIKNFTEVSAVCTHPDYLGKGYASALVQHQVNLILHQGQVPFLHVREDNQRAIEVYQRTGFKISRSMNFYFLKRKSIR